MDFEGEYNESCVRTKADCRGHFVDKTKGDYILNQNREG